MVKNWRNIAVEIIFLPRLLFVNHGRSHRNLGREYDSRLDVRVVPTYWILLFSFPGKSGCRFRFTTTTQLVVWGPRESKPPSAPNQQAKPLAETEQRRDLDFFQIQIPNIQYPIHVRIVHFHYLPTWMVDFWWWILRYVYNIYTSPIDPMDTACFKLTVVEHTFVPNMKSMCTVCIWPFLSHSFEIHPAPYKIQ